MSEVSEWPEFDLARWEKLAQVGHGALVRRLAGLLAVSIPERVAAVAAGVQGPLEPAMRAAHGLGPLAAQVGAMGLALSAERAERAGKAGDRQALAVAVDQLIPQSKQAIAWLSARVEAIPAQAHSSP